MPPGPWTPTHHTTHFKCSFPGTSQPSHSSPAQPHLAPVTRGCPPPGLAPRPPLPLAAPEEMTRPSRVCPLAPTSTYTKKWRLKWVLQFALGQVPDQGWRPGVWAPTPRPLNCLTLPQAFTSQQKPWDQLNQLSGNVQELWSPEHSPPVRPWASRFPGREKGGEDIKLVGI